MSNISMHIQYKFGHEVCTTIQIGSYTCWHFVHPQPNSQLQGFLKLKHVEIVIINSSHKRAKAAQHFYRHFKYRLLSLLQDLLI